MTIYIMYETTLGRSIEMQLTPHLFNKCPIVMSWFIKQILANNKNAFPTNMSRYNFIQQSVRFISFFSIYHVVFGGKDKIIIYDSHKTCISILVVFGWNVEKGSYNIHRESVCYDLYMVEKRLNKLKQLEKESSESVLHSSIKNGNRNMRIIRTVQDGLKTK